MPRLLKYADIKGFLNLQQPGEQAHLAFLLDKLTSRFEDHLGRKLEKVQRTETWYGSGRMVRLSALPIDSGQPITVTQGGATIASSGYQVRGFGLYLISNECSFDDPVTVTYTGGYSTTTLNGETFFAALPDGLLRAAMLQLAHENIKARNPGTEVIITDAGTAKAPPLELIKEVRAALGPYMHPMGLV